MDNRIRRNEHCIINQPNCDYVFSSTRTCFIAYGYDDSTLAMNTIRSLLKENDIHAEEAGVEIAPGSNVFCSKICSKIIASQFCIILINNHIENRKEIPNANVNMEYGLMLGFNKYVIPFQLETQKLPFNISGLDTVKYNQRNLESLARKAIDRAIKDTKQKNHEALSINENIFTFLYSKKYTMSMLSNPGDNDLYNLGTILGFNLFHDFAGFGYLYWGNLAPYRKEFVVWRITTLDEIISERLASIPRRKEFIEGDEKGAKAATLVLKNAKIWCLVTSKEEKAEIKKILSKKKLNHEVKLFYIDEIQAELDKLFS